MTRRILTGWSDRGNDGLGRELQPGGEVVALGELHVDRFTNHGCDRLSRLVCTLGEEAVIWI